MLALMLMAASRAGALFGEGVLINWGPLAALGSDEGDDGTASIELYSLYASLQNAILYLRVDAPWLLCAPNPYCGDGTCDSGETCTTCAGDCACGSQQQCTAGVCVKTCGNGICEAGFGELCSNCSDCACGSGNVCSDGICVAGCTGDEQCPFGQYCRIGCCGCSGPNPGTCELRKPAGSQCCRTGECWITGSGQPSPCVWSDLWQANVCQ
jgi:hypothetical protein